jgi:hypothetical protein
MGKTVAWIGGIFAPIGLVLAALGGWFYFQDRAMVEDALSDRGTVLQLAVSSDSDGYSYRPVVMFIDAEGDRRVFTGQVGSNPPSYSPGEQVTVLYRPEAPDKAVIDSVLERFFLPLLLGGMGTLFASIGLGLLYAWFRRRRLVARLRTSGLPIQAKFVECYRDTRIEVNGRSPFRVVCQATHPATGQLQSFESDPIWIDLTGRLAGRDLRVFVDPARPRHHAVDLTGLVGEGELA